MITQDWTFNEWTNHLLWRLREVRANLHGEDVSAVDSSTTFADALDSMGIVEFLAIVAQDCGVTAETIEQAAGGRFTTIAELARMLSDGPGFIPASDLTTRNFVGPAGTPTPRASAWLAGTAVGLPESIQSASEINELLQRPVGWLETHANIQQRRVWGNQDPLSVAADVARQCMEKVSIATADIGALLVTSEAPPVWPGLATAVHHRLRLAGSIPALEIGGACAGFLAALRIGRALVHEDSVVLVVSIEAATKYLALQPGAAGEAAALFGDAVAACILTAEPGGTDAVSLGPITLGTDGGGASLLRVNLGGPAGAELVMDGIPLSRCAVAVMAQSTLEVVHSHGLELKDLAGVVCHGGNGRLPMLLARQLGLSHHQVWSETSATGNLGSASLPVAWHALRPRPAGPVVWTAVGAGLSWGAALLGAQVRI